MPDDLFCDTSHAETNQLTPPVTWPDLYPVNRAPDAARLQVLIVEDQFLNSEFLRIWVEALGHKVCGIATSAEGACHMALKFQPDLILTDYLLEGEGDGSDAARAICSTLPTPIVFVTASVEEAPMSRMLAVNPLRVIAKPAAPEELSEVLSLVASARRRPRRMDRR